MQLTYFKIIYWQGRHVNLDNLSRAGKLELHQPEMQYVILGRNQYGQALGRTSMARPQNHQVGPWDRYLFSVAATKDTIMFFFQFLIPSLKNDVLGASYVLNNKLIAGDRILSKQTEFVVLKVFMILRGSTKQSHGHLRNCNSDNKKEKFI